MQKHSSFTSSGFTIVELLVTIGIFGILAAIAFPQINSVSDNNRLVQQINNLSSNLQYARSEAIRRVRNITVVTLNTTNQWDSGWQVYIDLNNNGVPDAGELLREVASLGATTTFLGNGAASNQVVFTPNGRSNVIANTGTTFNLCQIGRTGSYGKTLVLYSSGRVEVNISMPCP